MTGARPRLRRIAGIEQSITPPAPTAGVTRRTLPFDPRLHPDPDRCTTLLP